MALLNEHNNYFFLFKESKINVKHLIYNERLCQTSDAHLNYFSWFHCTWIYFALFNAKFKLFPNSFLWFQVTNDNDYL